MLFHSYVNIVALLVDTKHTFIALTTSANGSAYPEHEGVIQMLPEHTYL